MEKESLKELFNQAKDLHNSNDFIKSNEILLDLLDRCKNDEQKEAVLMLISGNYYKLENYKTSIFYAKKVLGINKDEELASLGIYLCYVFLKEYGLALKEIFRFLKDHEAVIYKDTLEELLLEIEKGNIQDDREVKTIQYLAEKNKVKLEG